VILHNIELLKTDPNAFSFDQLTNMIILEVGGLQPGREGSSVQASFSSNIHNLAIINSTMLHLNPNLFSKELKPFQFHLVGSVFSSDSEGYLFNFEKSQMARLVVKGCTVTSTHKSSFIKAIAANVEVVESRLTLEASTGFHLIGNNVTLKRSTITASSENAISLQTNDNLNIEENIFKENNPLHLDFPDLGVRSITLRGTDLKRPKKDFIRAKVLETLKIENCQMKLDNEEAFVIDVQHLTIANSTVYSMNTGSFKARVRKKVEILDSVFEHCQEKVFYEIRPTKSSTMIMKRNTFFKFEDGFLKLDEFIERNLNEFNIDISRLDLLKECHCSLAHEVITEDTVGDNSALKARIGQEELEKTHTDHTEGHLDFEQRLQNAFRCSTKKEELIELKTFISSSCSSSSFLWIVIPPSLDKVVWRAESLERSEEANSVIIHPDVTEL